MVCQSIVTSAIVSEELCSLHDKPSNIELCLMAACQGGQFITNDHVILYFTALCTSENILCRFVPSSFCLLPGAKAYCCRTCP